MKLDQKVVLVTGANRGIGAAIVRELLNHHVGKIYAAARNVNSLPDFGDIRVVPIALDVTDSAQIEQVAQVADDVQLLINNAGSAHFGNVADTAIADFAADMNANYYGPLQMMQAFVPVLKKQGGGIIANVISVVGFASFRNGAGYSASKAALHSLTQGARAELAEAAIKVLGIYPGPIDTDMAKSLDMDKATPASAAQKIVAGLIAEAEYIFPDPMSEKVGAFWASDPRGLEQQFSS